MAAWGWASLTLAGGRGQSPVGQLRPEAKVRIRHGRSYGCRGIKSIDHRCTTPLKLGTEQPSSTIGGESCLVTETSRRTRGMMHAYASAWARRYALRSVSFQMELYSLLSRARWRAIPHILVVWRLYRCTSARSGVSHSRSRAWSTRGGEPRVGGRGGIIV
jgi:hypothetical protein